jgi:hypothetical protein
MFVEVGASANFRGLALVLTVARLLNQPKETAQLSHVRGREPEVFGRHQGDFLQPLARAADAAADAGVPSGFFGAHVSDGGNAPESVEFAAQLVKLLATDGACLSNFCGRVVGPRFKKCHVVHSFR